MKFCLILLFSFLAVTMASINWQIRLLDDSKVNREKFRLEIDEIKTFIRSLGASESPHFNCLNELVNINKMIENRLVQLTLTTLCDYDDEYVDLFKGQLLADQTGVVKSVLPSDESIDAMMKKLNLLPTFALNKLQPKLSHSYMRAEFKWAERLRKLHDDGLWKITEYSGIKKELKAIDDVFEATQNVYEAENGLSDAIRVFTILSKNIRADMLDICNGLELDDPAEQIIALFKSLENHLANDLFTKIVNDNSDFSRTAIEKRNEYMAIFNAFDNAIQYLPEKIIEHIVEQPRVLWNNPLRSFSSAEFNAMEEHFTNEEKSISEFSKNELTAIKSVTKKAWLQNIKDLCDRNRQIVEHLNQLKIGVLNHIAIDHMLSILAEIPSIATNYRVFGDKLREYDRFCKEYNLFENPKMLNQKVKYVEMILKPNKEKILEKSFNIAVIGKTSKLYKLTKEALFAVLGAELSVKKEVSTLNAYFTAFDKYSMQLRDSLAEIKYIIRHSSWDNETKKIKLKMHIDKATKLIQDSLAIGHVRWKTEVAAQIKSFKDALNVATTAQKSLPDDLVKVGHLKKPAGGFASFV